MYGVSHLDVSESVALVTFRKIPCQLPLISDIFSRFSKNNILIDMISQTAPAGEFVSISFTCMEDDLVKVLEISNELNHKYPQIKPMVSSGNCKIQLFGEEMRAASGVFSRALAALTSIPMELQQVTTSEVDISLLVTAPHKEAAVQALKASFNL